jgi:LPS-assembly protein
MIAPLHRRALLSAGFCCAPVFAALAADRPGSDASSVATITGTPVTALMVEEACDPAVQTDPNAARAAHAGAQAAAHAGAYAGAYAADGPARDGSIVVAAASAPARPTAANRNALRITGDITTDSDHLTNLANGQTVLTGDVDVHMGERELQADQLTYDSNSNSMSVSGQVRFSDPTVQVQGDTGRYGDDGAMFNHAHFQFLKLPGYGSADQISITPANVVTLRNVTYTTCPRPRADWLLHAHQLRLDQAAGVGVGRGAVVDFEGVPVMYLPWISFPLSDARKSGFLFPDFSTSSRSGVLLSAPWYWNIAPNQDATFTPRYYSQRGLDAGVEYRFLSAANTGSIDADYLNHDQAYALEQKQLYGNDSAAADRSYVRILDRLQLGGNTRLDANVQNVSDTEYFEDFTQGAQSTSTPFLARDIALGHRDDIWNLRAELLGFETLDNTLPDYEHPYMQLPRLSAAGLWSPPPWPALTLGFESELANFTRDCHVAPAAASVAGADLCTVGDVVSGWRVDARPQLGLDVSGPGYFFRPDVAWEFTQYSLRDNATPDSTPQRSLPIVSVDSGLQFERLAGSNGVRSITLEPRLMYVYIPYRDQDQLPIFDSSSPDLNLIELFRPNRYVGIDRIGDANELTMGVTTQMFDSASGVRYLSATIGQRLYLQPPRVALQSIYSCETRTLLLSTACALQGVTLPEGTAAGSSTSSLVAETNLTAYRNWNLLLDVASNPSVSRVDEAEVILQYRASSRQVANVSYRYLYGQLQQIDGSEAWTLGGHWEAYARAVYSLYGNRAATPAVHPEWIQDFAGFQYRGACWSIRIVAQRSVTTRTGEQDTGVSLQLELTGLSNVGNGVGTGSGLTTFLEQSIRGYSATAPKP